MKTNNFLVNVKNNSYELLIADFGTAHFKKLDNKNFTQFTMNSLKGTETYLAPELYNYYKSEYEDEKF